MNSYRTVEYAFMIEMLVKGKWENEVGTRKRTQAMEVVGLYPAHCKLRILRCHDGEIIWQSHGENAK